jgi:hypothetical protein
MTKIMTKLPILDFGLKGLLHRFLRRKHPGESQLCIAKKQYRKIETNIP